MKLKNRQFNKEIFVIILVCSLTANHFINGIKWHTVFIAFFFAVAGALFWTPKNLKKYYGIKPKDEVSQND